MSYRFCVSCVSACNQLLNFLEHFLEMMTGGYFPHDTILPAASTFFLFLNEMLLCLLNAVTDVGFLFQNAFTLCNRPRRLFFCGRTGVDIGESPVSFIVQPAGGRYFFLHQNPCNAGGSRLRAARSKIFSTIPACFRVDQKMTIFCRVFYIASGAGRLHSVYAIANLVHGSLDLLLVCQACISFRMFKNGASSLSPLMVSTLSLMAM